jgi:hypothetical protein
MFVQVRKICLLFLIQLPNNNILLLDENFAIATEYRVASVAFLPRINWQLCLQRKMDRIDNNSTTTYYCKMDSLFVIVLTNIDVWWNI